MSLRIGDIFSESGEDDGLLFDALSPGEHDPSPPDGPGESIRIAARLGVPDERLHAIWREAFGFDLEPEQLEAIKRGDPAQQAAPSPPTPEQ